jgi:hypothetical protein
MAAGVSGSGSRRTTMPAYRVWRKPQNAREVLVEGNENALFRAADHDERPVRRGAKILSGHGGHVAAAIDEDLLCPRAEVLVQLQSHRTAQAM